MSWCERSFKSYDTRMDKRNITTAKKAAAPYTSVMCKKKEKKMIQFSKGDKVKIIEMLNTGKRYINQVGTVIPPGGTYEDDDVYVKLKDENIILVKENQLALFL